MDLNSQVLLSIGIPTIAVLVGILLSNRQIDGLRAHMDAQFVSLRSEMSARFAAVDARFMVVDARFATVDERFNAAREAMLRVEEILDARLGRLEDRERQ